ncbi:MAG: YraN family protein [Cellvibrio sp.]|uniref:YraN family protein n=1 Tax=Cellvibrio sp. TaxID=1965322 RepID=UPI00272440C5|nr:YraN family protein [Cellvibrio sp.]
MFKRDKDDAATANTDNDIHNSIRNTINIGAQAEAQAEAFLHQQGLVTRTKNYRCKLGEIDLIMLQKTARGTCFVFVEVRLRTNKRFAPAIETVDYRKQQKIIRTATRFLQEQRLFDKVACRFDVIALDQTGTAPPIQWIQNAFGA